MKKIIFITFILVLSACSHQESPLPQKDAVADINKNQQEEKIVDTNQEQTETEKKIAPSVVQPSPASELRAPTLDDIHKWPEEITVTLVTNVGDITIGLLPKKAPLAVANFLSLAQGDFYDGVSFHRVTEEFMVTGDPNSKDTNWSDDGAGGPGYTFPDEVSSGDSLIRGVVAMANKGPNTNGSQFFFVTTDLIPPHGRDHTIFGNVTEGMDVLQSLLLLNLDTQGNTQGTAVVENIIIHESL